MMSDVFSQNNSRRNPYFEQLLKEGTNTSPIKHWSQGASRLAFALLAGMERNAQEDRAREGMATLMQKQPFQPTRQAPPMPTMASPPAAGVNAPGPQPFQMPLMTGPSGQPIRPSGFVGDNVNVFDPQPMMPTGPMGLGPAAAAPAGPLGARGMLPLGWQRGGRR